MASSFQGIIMSRAALAVAVVWLAFAFLIVMTWHLPFLDAMVPAATALAQTAAAPKTRAGFFYIPHGAIANNTPFGSRARN